MDMLFFTSAKKKNQSASWAQMLSLENHSIKCFLQLWKTILDMSADQISIWNSHLNTTSIKSHSLSFTFLCPMEYLIGWNVVKAIVYLSINKEPEDCVHTLAQFNVLFNDSLKLWLFPLELNIANYFCWPPAQYL